METLPPLPPLSILAVEDNPADIATVEWVLRAHALSYDLQVIANAEHAFRFFDQFAQPRPRAVPIFSCSISPYPSAMARNSCTICRPSPRVPPCAS